MINKPLHLILIVFLALLSDLAASATVASPWFKGSIDEAFQAAKRRNTPMLLYWGAVWCPPCNELKSQVFSHPGFRPLVSNVVAVYLDGDTEAAQTWGEKLGASGYPTVLLLNKGGKEILRLDTSVTFEEFRESFQAALSLKVPVHELLEHIAKGKVGTSSWQSLAFNQWEQLLSKEQKSGLPALLLNLFQSAPEKETEIKAALAAKTLEAFARGDTKKSEPGITKEQIAGLTKAVFNGSSAHIAARNILIYKAEKVLPWLSASAPPAIYLSALKNWKKAIDDIANNTDMSTDTRLWARYAEKQLFAIENGADKKLPPSLVRKIKVAAINAEKKAKSSYERHAVVSGAAYILRKISAWEEAVKILEKELKETDTPWYYQSSLASLEEERGNHHKSLYWSGEARTSARGNATKIQWIVTDLVRTIRLSPGDLASVNDLLRQYYELAIQLEDGFKGRNSKRADQLQKAILKILPEPSVSKTLASYRTKCNKNSPECTEHFRGFEGRQKQAVKGS